MKVTQLITLCIKVMNRYKTRLWLAMSLIIDQAGESMKHRNTMPILLVTLPFINHLYGLLLNETDFQCYYNYYK